MGGGNAASYVAGTGGVLGTCIGNDNDDDDYGDTCSPLMCPNCPRLNMS